MVSKQFPSDVELRLGALNSRAFYISSSIVNFFLSCVYRRGYSLSKLDTSANGIYYIFTNLQGLFIEPSLRSASTAQGPSGF